MGSLTPLALRALRVVSAFRIRRALAQAVELIGFAGISLGVDLIAGRGVALVVAGVLFVLLAFEVDR